MVYSYGGLAVSSVIPLPAPRFEAAVPLDCRIEDGPLTGPTAGPPIDGTGDWPRVDEAPGGYLLTFRQYATFEVSSDGASIRVWAGPEGDPTTTRHLLLDQVLPRVLTLRRRVVLHGSVVADAGRAAVFIGESGAGKSTLAAAFLRAGCAVLSDDAAVLEPLDGRTVVHPTYPYLRLWPDVMGHVAPPAAAEAIAHYNDKRGFTLDQATTLAALPVDRLYLLDSAAPAPGTLVEITPLPGARCLVMAMQHAFRLGPLDPPAIGRSLDDLAALDALKNARVLRHRRDLGALPDVVEAVRREWRRG